MSFSQNVRFNGVVPVDASEPHPPGRALATLIEAAVRTAGWHVLMVDDWRDCGWEIICDRGRVALDVVVAAMEPSEWMVQIAPTSLPKFVLKLRGWEPFAERSDVYELATHIDASLARQFGTLRWCWDDFPDDSAAPHPTPWKGFD